MADSLAEQARAIAETLRGYSDRAQTASEKAIQKGALMVEADAKRNCPAKTGFLRNSITSQFFKNSGSPYALVGSNTVYAPFVEYGTSRQPPQPYLSPAFNENAAEIKAMIREAMRG